MQILHRPRTLARTLAVSDVSLGIGTGEFICIVGSSGCGKSTVMNMIAVLDTPSESTIGIDGRTVTGPGADRGVMFQDYALCPWLTVEQNIGFGLHNGMPGDNMLPLVKRSPFHPDGYYLHRSFWLAHNNLLDKNPKIALAFLLAQQDCVAALSEMDAGDVSQLVKDYWKLDAAQDARAVDDDVLERRGWICPTETDARAMLETSKYLVDAKVIPAPLNWKQVKGTFERTASIVREVCERLGSQPGQSEFIRTDVGDLRGRPIWEMDQWAKIN